jgi:hypothetical protein
MKAITIILIIILFLVAGCSKVYVCYDGTTKKVQSLCPTVPSPHIEEQEAARAIDNYGTAIAQAKGDVYTRVNIYSQNTTWYSGVLFTNMQTQNVKQAIFKIDGKTATVTCQSGCDYVTFSK